MGVSGLLAGLRTPNTLLCVSTHVQILSQQYKTSRESHAYDHCPVLSLFSHG